MKKKDVEAKMHTVYLSLVETTNVEDDEMRDALRHSKPGTPYTGKTLWAKWEELATALRKINAICARRFPDGRKSMPSGDQSVLDAMEKIKKDYW